MREDVVRAIGKVKLVVEAVRVICCILPYVPYDDGRFTAKVL